jgi:type II secretory pathway component PulC
MSVLNDQALAFYRKEEIAVLSLLVGPGMVSSAGTDPDYSKFLKNQGITLSLPPTGDRPINGFIERFERAIRKDFLAEALLSQECHDLESLQSCFKDWLELYNNDTPLPGYPIMGRTPLDAFRAAAAPNASEEKIEDRPRLQPEPSPAPVSFPAAAAAAPSPPASRIHQNHEWKPGREIWGFRTINAALICLLIYFGWLSASRLLDAKWLEVDLGSEASLQQAPVLNYSEAQDRTSPLDEYHVVWDRNLFAVSRAAEVAARREKIAVEKIAVADRNVGLKLIGTVVTNDPKLNYAVIDVAATREQGIFREKDRVGKAVIKVILRNIVIIETDDGQRRRLSVDEELLRTPMALPAGLGLSPESPAASFGVIQGDGSTFQVLREEVPSSPEDIQNFIEKFNLNSQDDSKKFTGFSVGRMRASYLLYQLGLRTGDVIKGLDDYEFSNPGDLEYFFQRLAQGGDFRVMVERRGQLQKLDVLIE